MYICNTHFLLTWQLYCDVLFTASDHKQSTAAQNETEKRAQTTSWIPSQVYEEIFPPAFHSALKEIQNSALHNMFGKSPISEIAEYCEHFDQFQTAVKQSFNKLASEPVNIMQSDDRENLFSKFHQLRLSSDVENMESKLLNSSCPCSDEISNFVQIFLMQLTNSLLQFLTKTMEHKGSQDCATLSDNEQKVLYYISGFVIYALKKRYNKINQEKVREKKLSIMDSLTCKNSEESFVKKYSSLLDKKNRGGLMYPCENFFLLIRSIDAVARECTTDKLCQHSLYNCSVKEKVMENFMVKHYTEKLFSFNSINTCTEDDMEEYKPLPSHFLEDIVSTFVTVHGFATARVERNKLVKNSKMASKKGGSFREALKERSVNPHESNVE